MNARAVIEALVPEIKRKSRGFPEDRALEQVIFTAGEDAYLEVDYTVPKEGTPGGPYHGMYVLDIHVEPNLRQQGLATALMDRAAREVKRGGSLDLGTVVAPKAAAPGLVRMAKRLCQKHGLRLGDYYMDPQ